jgi:hypothetical protein
LEDVTDLSYDRLGDDDNDNDDGGVETDMENNATFLEENEG